MRCWVLSVLFLCLLPLGKLSSILKSLRFGCYFFTEAININCAFAFLFGLRLV